MLCISPGWRYRLTRACVHGAIDNLVVGGITLSTAAAHEQIWLGSSLVCHLMVVNCLPCQLCTQFFHFIARHLVRCHYGEPTGCYHAYQDVLAQPRVSRVLQWPQQTYFMTIQDASSHHQKKHYQTTASLRHSTQLHQHIIHHHHRRAASEGRRVVAPPYPQSTAHLQSSPIRRVELFHSWLSHLFRGRPGGWHHVCTLLELQNLLVSCALRTICSTVLGSFFGGGLQYSWVVMRLLLVRWSEGQHVACTHTHTRLMARKLRQHPITHFLQAGCPPSAAQPTVSKPAHTCSDYPGGFLYTSQTWSNCWKGDQLKKRTERRDTEQNINLHSNYKKPFDVYIILFEENNTKKQIHL